jgi:hypothetical protein
LCASSGAVKHHFALPGHWGAWLGTLFVRRRLQDIARSWRSDLLLALDDVAAWLLRSLAFEIRVGSELRELLVNSFGDPAGYANAVSRQGLMDAAARVGVRKPEHCDGGNPDTALAAAKHWGFPLVVKRDLTCGGRGVSIAQSADQLLAMLPSNADAPWPRKIKTAAKRIMFKRAGFRLASLSGSILQSFVAGTPAFRTLVAWRGRVISGVSFIVEQTHPPTTGASTVIRYIENNEIDRTAALITAELGCSGFISFDFLLDQATGHALVIEMNPRSISSTHLGALFGHDLCGSLVAAMKGAPEPGVQPPRTAATGIALYPHELLRDPDSPYLRSENVLHDVPSHDPKLMAAYRRRLNSRR